MTDSIDPGIHKILETFFPDFHLQEEPERLAGGNLNFVWRIKGKLASYIVKKAPPFIATSPEIPMNPDRIQFEANILQRLEKYGRFDSIDHPSVRAPHLIACDETNHILIMEDAGDGPDLHEKLKQGESVSDDIRKLGSFIGRLHRVTNEDEMLFPEFNNKSIQETRNQVQYQSIGTWFKNAGSKKWRTAGSKAESLGNTLLERGHCLVMGDLWPPSILYTNKNELRIIDWEFVHYGRPLQDIAHFTAHLWMHGNSPASQLGSDDAQILISEFLGAYRKNLGEVYHELINDREREFASIHFGSEIMIRAVGAFKNGYLYGKFNLEKEVIIDAIRMAETFIMNPEQSLWFDEI